jgi:CRISPR-associated protein Csb2
MPAHLIQRQGDARSSGKPRRSVGAKTAHYLCFSLQCPVPLLPRFIVPLSEKFRDAANSHLCRIHGDGTPSFALFGHAKDRPPDAVGDHQHAFYLPMAKAEDPSGHLSDLHIWCPYGFTQEEVNIFLRIQRLDWGGGKYPVRPVLTALSKEPPKEAPFSIGEKAARIWRSASPFVPPRYFYRGSGDKVKLKDKDRPELQLAECLRAVGVTVGGQIRHCRPFGGSMQNDNPVWDIVRAGLGEETVGGAPMVTVPTHRNGSSGRGGMEQRIGGFYEVEFEEPVALKQPALGHSCHFGLGLFIPA